MIIIKKIERMPLSVEDQAKYQLFGEIINEIMNKIDDYSNESIERDEGIAVVATFKVGELLLGEFEGKCIGTGFRSRGHCIRTLMRLFIDVVKRKLVMQT